MSVNYTQHLGLSLWAADDPVLRSEFNANNNKLDSYIRKLPRITTGSYVGTGLSGPESPTVLDFNFAPHLVIITENSTSSLYPGAVFIRGQTESSGLGYLSSSSDSLNLYLSWIETSLSFYNQLVSGSSRAELQFNKEGVTYHFCALGV